MAIQQVRVSWMGRLRSYLPSADLGKRVVYTALLSGAVHYAALKVSHQATETFRKLMESQETFSRFKWEYLAGQLSDFLQIAGATGAASGIVGSMEDGMLPIVADIIKIGLPIYFACLSAAAGYWDRGVPGAIVRAGTVLTGHFGARVVGFGAVDIIDRSTASVLRRNDMKGSVMVGSGVVILTVLSELVPPLFYGGDSILISDTRLTAVSATAAAIASYWLG